ncbi:MAG: NAD(P)-dependent oxidoreductase [Arenicella sp.]
MKNVGFVGLGDMGMGMAKNLMDKGFSVIGHDLKESLCKELIAASGECAVDCKTVGATCKTVFVMVMNGQQVKDVVTELCSELEAGSTIIVTATIHPAQIKEAELITRDHGVELIDSPVSGGLPGSIDGSLTLMVAAKTEILLRHRAELEAISANIFHVGQTIGSGQTVKAALQAYIGASYAAIFESLVLGSKAGISGKVLYDVFSTSSAASPLFENCAKLIMDRKFENTGSQIATMYKDLGITMNMGKEKGVPLFTTAAAFELFLAGNNQFPNGDNWSIVKTLEQLSDTQVTW